MASSAQKVRQYLDKETWLKIKILALKDGYDKIQDYIIHIFQNWIKGKEKK